MQNQVTVTKLLFGKAEKIGKENGAAIEEVIDHFKLKKQLDRVGPSTFYNS